MRDSFVFYKSYYDAIELLPKSQRADAYRAIFEFMFNGNDITDELKDTAKAIFLMAKPTLESSVKKYEAGKKGAEAKKATSQANDKQPTKQSGSNRPSKTQATSQANDKQPTKQSGSNVNDNVNVNDNENVEEKKRAKKEELFQQVQEQIGVTQQEQPWLEDFYRYRREIGQPVKTSRPLKQFLVQLREIISAGYDAHAAIETMKDNEWRTLELEWVQNKLGKPEEALSDAERLRRIN